MKNYASVVLFSVLLSGCAPRSHTAHEAREDGAPRAELAWAPFSAETFARAKATGRFVVLDGSAEWCHWCHVMEAVTYHDPKVRALLDRHFIAVKVDVDARPDLAERYGDYGWPATVIFSPDATELGKYRGYIAPEKFAVVLGDIVSGASTEIAEDTVGHPNRFTEPLSEQTLSFITRAVDVELDDYWDEDEGGWGRTQKAPLGWNNLWMLRRGATDPIARKKAALSLEKQAALIDPVWGGIYQYSAARDWKHPHFEKLMTFQAPALESYAVSYKATHDAADLARARSIWRYIERFLKGPEGGFFTTQDADLNAHDRAKPFMTGHEYYALSEPQRLAVGVPRVDDAEYGRENGLAIAAYVAMFEATRDEAVLAAATRAGARVLATHATPRGGISHGILKDNSAAPLFLADNAAFGYALMRLFDVTGDRAWLATATSVFRFMKAELEDPISGALFANTRDEAAAGVFASRRVPFEDNVMALRMLARLARHDDPDIARDAREMIVRILAAISTPEEIKARGRMLGDYLLALEETRGAR